MAWLVPSVTTFPHICWSFIRLCVPMALVIAGVSSYYTCIDWGDLIFHNLAFCIKLQLKFDFRLILIQLRFIPNKLLFLSRSHRKCLAYVCFMICVKRLMKTTFKTSLI